MCSLEGESWTHWSESQVFARTRHVCSCCDRFIEKGEPYLKHSNLFDGRWTSEKSCAPCAIARNEFCGAHGWTVAPSQFYQELVDCVSDERDGEWRQLLAVVKSRYRTSPARCAGLKRVSP